MSGYSVPGATGVGYGYDQFSEAEPIFPDFDRPFPKKKVMIIDNPPPPKVVYNSKANALAKLESKQNAMLNAAAEAAANAVVNKAETRPAVEPLQNKKNKRSKKEHLTDFNEAVIKIFPQDLIIIFVVFVIIVMCFSMIRSLNNIQHSLKDIMYMNMVLLSKYKNQ